MLKKIRFSEFQGESRFWEVGPCDFVEKNLIVGRNATGKTRFLNVINGLHAILSGKRPGLFISGEYDAEFEFDDSQYNLHLELNNFQIKSEKLLVNGTERLVRGAKGQGRIYYEKEKKSLDFVLPSNVSALVQRRDELQHPFIAKVGNWAANVRYFQFGSSLGREFLPALQPGTNELQTSNPEQNVVSAYIAAFNTFGHKLDKAILKDMASVGYELEDVGVKDIKSVTPHAIAPDGVLSLFVKEKGRASDLGQIDMSQGMFRALTMVIYINIAVLEKYEGLILIDDIGEGLDYDRSTRLIDLLFKRLKKVQIITTTNDRFVMNKVPLENWCLLRREGPTVHAYTERSNPTEFADFKYVGLSNFEFFASSPLVKS